MKDLIKCGLVGGNIIWGCCFCRCDDDQVLERGHAGPQAGSRNAANNAAIASASMTAPLAFGVWIVNSLKKAGVITSTPGTFAKSLRQRDGVRMIERGEISQARLAE